MTSHYILCLELLNVAKSTVSKILKNYKDTGSYLPKTRCGRPKKISSRTIKNIVRTVNENPFISSSALSNQIFGINGEKISSSSVRSFFIQNDLRAYTARKKPFLTKIAKQKRLEWCKKYESKPQSFWNKILWTDESRLSLFASNKPPLVRRRKSESLNESFLIPTTKHPVSVMIWCGFSASGIGPLKIIDGTMDTDKYISTLEECFLPYQQEDQSVIMQEDNAPCHNSKASQAFKVKMVSIL